MSTYRIDGIKYNPANWASLDASERAACNRFAAARERELNTITATPWTCKGGPFAGHPIELESTTDRTAPLNVGAWAGHYELQTDPEHIKNHGRPYMPSAAPRVLVWVGTDGGATINTHAHTTDTKKQAAEVTARGFDQLRDLLADLAEDPTERATVDSEAGPTKPRARYTIGRTTYTIAATPEAADRLRARIMKAKRWFSDKLLATTRPAAPTPATEDTPDAGAILAASVAIATAQASSASTEQPETTADDAAELVTCDGPELVDAVATVADTPAPMADAIGASDTPADTQAADCTAPHEPRAQAGDYTGARETLRADYLRAADAGHTQQVGSKSGAWSAVMFRTEAGRAGLAFKRPGQPVDLVDCATGSERMRALQAMARAAEQSHQKPRGTDTQAAPEAQSADCTQAPETMSPDCTTPRKTPPAATHDTALAQRLADQAGNFSPEQCEQVARSLEHDNNHGGALMWRCMGARAFDLAARAAANVQAHDLAGHLTNELAAKRAAISGELRARQQNAADCNQAPETLATDCTALHETQATETDAEKFQRAQPQHVDLRHFLAGGVTPAQLVGLGVHYTGDMANASGQGAIVEAQADPARGVRVSVTLEDGRHMTHLDGYSFSDRPGSRFALNAKVHGAPYMAELAAARAALIVSTEAAKTSKAQYHASELERLAAEFPHLERAGKNDHGGKFAARNIRTMLKAAFPGVKFSVTSDYSCVRVRWTDGPTDAQVKATIGRFDIGRADYNTDYFYTTSSAWSDLFGGVQYLFTNRDESPELLASVLEAYNAQYHTTATPEDWRKQSGPFSFSSRDGDAHRRWFRDMLNKTDATPAAKTPRKAQA